MAAVFQRPAARCDLLEHYVYLAENAGEALADRFLANVETAFTELSEHPDIGAPLTLRRPELAGLRKWPVKEFENFLIFYVPRAHGVSVVRVLCGAGLVESAGN
jgi:toxin ParE1/3/4